MVGMTSCACLVAFSISLLLTRGGLLEEEEEVEEEPGTRPAGIWRPGERTDGDEGEGKEEREDERSEMD